MLLRAFVEFSKMEGASGSVDDEGMDNMEMEGDGDDCRLSQSAPGGDNSSRNSRSPVHSKLSKVLD